LQLRVDWYEFTHVSEVCTASMALMMDAVQTSETFVNRISLHGATTQKTAIFIIAAVRTSSHTNIHINADGKFYTAK
jgi:hypothetical protein